MEGTFIDFLEFLNENEDLRKDVVAIANKHGFQFNDEVSDAELEAVAGGALLSSKPSNVEQLVSGGSTSTSFENFDQKSNQLFQILSTVMKGTKEMQQAVTRNML